MKLYMKYLLIHLKSAMEYKTSFILTALGQGITTLTSFLAMYFLFQRFGGIKGYSFEEVLLCFSTIFIAFAIAECFGRGFDNFSSIISNGDFDRIMVRPRNEILQVMGTKIELTRVGRLLQGMAILFYALYRTTVDWTFMKISALILMILGGVALFFGIFMIGAALSFFTIEGLEIINIFTDGGREIAQYPIDIYKKSVLKFFTFVVPLAFVNYYPFIYIIDKVPQDKILYALSPLVAIAFLIPSYLIWTVGVAHYKSTGS
ncbi:MAG: ABC-2 family transporter protein [Clostridium sp.]|uniref:ABC transporter permease n=1 Tax=Clostridium sp. TaxID=1506 RepID=UPI002A84C18E|nr:ABC-2 family transporter protein [Clostridium sp.]MDY5098908.1 ABC-2 family transporter protein [Clostridium sp.]